MHQNSQTSQPWEKLLAANDESTSFGALAPTATEPTTGVIDLSAGKPGMIPEWVQFVFFGAGSNDQTFSARVVGWDLLGTTWVPVPLVELAVTLGQSVGAAGLGLVAADRLADTLAFATAFNALLSPACILTSPTGDLIANALVSPKGHRKLQVQFDMTGATSGNALYRRL